MNEIVLLSFFKVVVKLLLGISDYVINFIMRNINKKASYFSSNKASIYKAA